MLQYRVNVVDLILVLEFMLSNSFTFRMCSIVFGCLPHFCYLTILQNSTSIASMHLIGKSIIIVTECKEYYMIPDSKNRLGITHGS